ncbi:unnamed protein product [Urochloa humidicola]
MAGGRRFPRRRSWIRRRRVGAKLASGGLHLQGHGLHLPGQGLHLLAHLVVLDLDQDEMVVMLKWSAG